MSARDDLEPTELTEAQRLIIGRHIRCLRDEAASYRATISHFEREYNYCWEYKNGMMGDLRDPERALQLKPFVIDYKHMAKSNAELADALEILLLGGKPINPASLISHGWRYGGG